MSYTLSIFYEKQASCIYLVCIQLPRDTQLKLEFFLDLEYQDGGDELQNLITEITEMRDPGLFISVGGRQWKLGGNKWWKNVTVLDHLHGTGFAWS